MKRFAVFLLVLGLFAPSAALSQEEKPKPQIDFSVAGRIFTARQNVPMSGEIEPATASERVTIKVQRYNRKREKWVRYSSHVVQSDDEGNFSFTHPPLRKGRYRARAQVRETDDHLAGKNRWKLYNVRRRAHG